MLFVGDVSWLWPANAHRSEVAARYRIDNIVQPEGYGMESVGVGSSGTWTRALALLAVAAITVIILAVPRGAEARTCHTATQNVTKLKNVSCKQAKKIVNGAYRSGKDVPECKGRDSSIRFKGWKFKAIDNRGIIVRVTKGNMRFILSGGGAC